MRRAFALLAGLALVVALVPSVAAAPPGVTKTADLFAGQTTDVGDVFVWNDATNLYIEIDLVSGWCMTESHVAVASTTAGIPQTKTGNPIPGKFAYGDTYDPCADGDVFTVPLSGFATPVIAVHAKVWDESSEVTVTAVSDTTLDFVYGPASTYLAPGNASWGASVPAVEPSFVTAAPGVWPTVAGAKWISTELIETTSPVPDSWRWHRTTMTIPAGSLPVSGSVTTVTSDNAERVWYNGTVIGTDGEVDVPYIDNQEWNTLLGYSFTPVVGANTLDFVWRNYGACTTTAFCTAPGLQLTPTQNPNGLIYKASVSYYARGESAWAGTAVGVTPFPGANWATYFGYTLQAVLVETVTVPATVPGGTTSTTVLASGRQYLFKVTGTTTWQNRNGYDIVDAECVNTSGGGWQQGVAGYDADLLNLQVNTISVDWTPFGVANTNGCDNNNEYTFSFTGTGATVDFRIYDGTGNVQNPSWFGDNAGSLTVQIWRTFP